MNKSQELMERMNSLKSFQYDNSADIDFERDRAVIEETYGPIMSETTEETLAYLDRIIQERKAKNG